MSLSDSLPILSLVFTALPKEKPLCWVPALMCLDCSGADSRRQRGEGAHCLGCGRESSSRWLGYHCEEGRWHTKYVYLRFQVHRVWKQILRHHMSPVHLAVHLSSPFLNLKRPTPGSAILSDYVTMESFHTNCFGINRGSGYSATLSSLVREPMLLQ